MSASFFFSPHHDFFASHFDLHLDPWVETPSFRRRLDFCVFFPRLPYLFVSFRFPSALDHLDLYVFSRCPSALHHPDLYAFYRHHCVALMAYRRLHWLPPGIDMQIKKLHTS